MPSMMARTIRAAMGLRTLVIVVGVGAAAVALALAINGAQSPAARPDVDEAEVLRLASKHGHAYCASQGPQCDVTVTRLADQPERPGVWWVVLSPHAPAGPWKLTPLGAKTLYLTYDLKGNLVSDSRNQPTESP